MSQLQTDRPDEFGDRKRAEMLRQVSQDAAGKVPLFRRVYAKKASPREAIKANCLMCCGFSEIAVRECSAPACPLWIFRPYREIR